MWNSCLVVVVFRTMTIVFQFHKKRVVGKKNTNGAVTIVVFVVVRHEHCVFERDKNVSMKGCGCTEKVCSALEPYGMRESSRAAIRKEMHMNSTSTSR